MKKLLFNIQLFAAPPGEGGGDNGAGGTVEVPEYISNYVSGIEDEGQREYLTGLIADEKGINLIKSFVSDPNKEWDIKAEDYKDNTLIDVPTYLQEAKEKGISEEAARTFLENRKEYITTQRELMSPELRALDDSIENFIFAEKDEGIKEVYARLAENAKGREVLQRIMQSGVNPTPGLDGNGKGNGEAYNHNTFIEAFNIASDTKNKVKLNELKTFANNSRDRFYKDFLGI